MPNEKLILIVEDDPIIAFNIEACVEDAGGFVLGPADNVETALELINETRPAFAFLDVEILGGFSFPIAKTLTEDGVKFAFVTGQREFVRKAGFAKALIIEKPFKDSEIENAIRFLFEDN